MTDRVLIVGAGIGGLAVALALRRMDLDVVVLEQDSELREIGAGVLLWPNAIRALRLLGIEDTVEVEGASPDERAFRTWRGAALGASVAEQLPARFGSPLVIVHRARLQSAMLEPLEPGVLRLDAECVTVEQTATSATIRLADGRTEEATLVVGADGLHSRVRTSVFAGRPPSYSGFTSWRGVVPLDKTLGDRVRAGESLGRGSLFGTAKLGGSQAYWWASARLPEGAADDPHADKASLLRRFHDWHDPIPELIAATPEASIVRSCLYERPLLKRVSLGRIALVGDAAHPMLPNLGQGACQTLEDATALASALAQTRNVVAALAAYSDRRAGHTAKVVRASRRTARIAHLRNPVIASVRNAAMRATPASLSLGRLAPIIDHTLEIDRRQRCSIHPHTLTGSS